MSQKIHKKGMNYVSGFEIISKEDKLVKIDSQNKSVILDLKVNGTYFSDLNEQSKEIVFTFEKACFSFKSNERWYFLNELLSWEIDQNCLKAIYQSNNGQNIKMNVKLEKKGIISFAYTIKETKNISWVSYKYRCWEDEHFFGFGEKFNDLDQKGKTVDLWVRNGASGDDTYKPIPFYFSTRNYGIYIDTTCRTLCHMGIPGWEEQAKIDVNDKELKFYLFIGDSPKDIIEKYTSITGRAELPPVWSFGPWKSRFAGDQKRHIIYEDADKHRELEIPCSVIVLDGWWDEDMFNPKFNSDYYPAGKEMVKELDNQGYKVIGWVAPWVVKEGKSYEDWMKCDAKDFFVKNKNGDSYVCRLANSPHSYGSILDFTNPEVREMWVNRIEGFMELGIDGIKTDFGEQVPPDAIFYNGKTGREMHNIYPYKYNQLTWEVISKKNGVLFGRSAWSGSQKYPGIWAGDQTADFCPWTGMGSVVIAGQAAALSGFPFWTSDIGGYFSSPTAECFIRWAQFSAFCPWMQIHGNGNHEAWNFDKMTEDIYRKYADMHTRLFPYLYSYAKEASEKGLPIIRPLVLNYSHDENIYKFDFASYEYQLGEELLIAPIYWGKMTARKVYLPEGKWIDFWSETEYEGNQVIDYKSPLEKMPVFIKEGSIIPLLRESKQTLVDLEDVIDLEVLIYCGNKDAGSFKMYDGTEFIYENSDEQHLLKFDSSSYKNIRAVFKGVDGDQLVKDISDDINGDKIG